MGNIQNQLPEAIPPDAYDKISVEAAQFIFKQAESLLCDTIEVRRSSEAKANTFIATLTPTIFALYSVSTGVIDVSNAIPGTYFASVISTALLSIALLLCMAIANPTQRQRIGSKPKDLYDEDWAKKFPDHQLAIYIINEINSYQRRAEGNLKRAKRQSYIIQIAVAHMVAAPVLAGAVIFLSWFCKPIT